MKNNNKNKNKENIINKNIRLIEENIISSNLLC